MPIKLAVLTAPVLTLIENAACATDSVDPSRFDEEDWTPSAAATITFYCDRCPMTARCADIILGPAKHAGFSGIAGGKVWRNGKPLPPRGYVEMTLDVG